MTSTWCPRSQRPCARKTPHCVYLYFDSTHHVHALLCTLVCVHVPIPTASGVSYLRKGNDTTRTKTHWKAFIFGFVSLMTKGSWPGRNATTKTKGLGILIHLVAHGIWPAQPDPLRVSPSFTPFPDGTGLVPSHLVAEQSFDLRQPRGVTPEARERMAYPLRASSWCIFCMRKPAGDMRGNCGFELRRVSWRQSPCGICCLARVNF